MEPNVPVKATATTFELIQELSKRERSSVTELADLVDRPVSTVHDHLNTLETLGYVVNDGRGYRIGLQFLELGERAREQFDIYSVAKPEVEKLSTKTQEHAHLVIEEIGLGAVLYSDAGEESVQVMVRPGTTTKLHATAPGKAILANLPESRVEAIIDRHGLPASAPNTITDPDRLFDELATIREQGYATDLEEIMAGLRGVATPILDRDDGSVKGALTVYGPANRSNPGEYEESTADSLKQSANIIEVNLSYS